MSPGHLTGPVQSAITGLICAAIAVRLGRAARRRRQTATVRSRLDHRDSAMEAAHTDAQAMAALAGRNGGREVLIILAIVSLTTFLDLPLWGVLMIGLLGALMVAAFGPSWLRKRQERAMDQQIPDALDVLAVLLRRGMTLSTALVDTGSVTPSPLGEELQRTGLDARHRGIAIALEELAQRHPRLATITLPLGIAATASVNATGIVTGLSTSLRNEAEVASEMAAQSAQATLSGLVMVVTPIGFAALLSMSDPGARQFLVATPVGLVCCAVGLGLDLVGWLWIRSITKSAQQ
jgi:tight adherence protein B